MIVEDEKDLAMIEENIDLNVAPSSSTVEAPEFSPDQEVPLERALEKDTTIRDRNAHHRLKNDLVEHIWNKFHGRRNRTGTCDCPLPNCLICLSIILLNNLTVLLVYYVLRARAELLFCLQDESKDESEDKGYYIIYLVELLCLAR
jgi:hypothetical protein